MSATPLSAVLPLTDEVHQAIFVEAAELPRLGQPARFALEGITLQVQFEGDDQVFSLMLGPAEWAKVQAGLGFFHTVDLQGEVVATYPVVLRAT